MNQNNKNIRWYLAAIAVLVFHVAQPVLGNSSMHCSTSCIHAVVACGYLTPDPVTIPPVVRMLVP